MDVILDRQWIIRDENLEKQFFIKKEPMKKNNLVFIESELKKALESLDYPPSSLRQISMRLGCDQGFLRKKFPQLCAGLIERYSKYVKKIAEEREQTIKSIITNTFLSILENLEYPSINKMRKTLEKPGLMRSKVAIRAYYEILGNFGLL